MTDQLRIFAGLQGFVSAAGLLALILFFALATPYGAEQRRWAWFGPVNDWLYVLGAAPWIIASVLLVVRGGLRRRRGGADRRPNWGRCATCPTASSSSSTTCSSRRA